MGDVTAVFDTGLSHWLVAGVLATIVGLLVLFWPGPLSVTDRLPFALVFLLSGSFAVYHAYAEATGPV